MKILKSQGYEKDRKAVEQKKCDVLLSVELSGKHDRPKYLDSGMNHILAKMATKNNIAIGIDFASISKLNKKQKAIILSRIKQNLKILRKANTKLALINIKDKTNAKNLLLSLGASTKQIKESSEKP